MSIINWSC